MKMILSPSVLSLDYSKLKESMDIVNQSEATWLHFDVMDGHFVPNLSFGPSILKGFDDLSDLFMDVHLMVTDPLAYIDAFVKNGADLITFHYEAYADKTKIDETIAAIKAKGIKVGLSIKPDTDVKVIEKYLPKLDLVLLMSVYPGFGGQAFIEDSVQRATQIRHMINQINPNVDLEIDGGINVETIAKAKDAGVNVFVAGSAVFKGDIAQNIKTLWNLVHSA